MEGYLNYAQILDEAMYSLIKNVLTKVAKNGLYGDHHLYISFVTGGEGVVLSKRMKQLYQNEITIVLQYQYNNLLVYDDKFSVDLAFNGISEKIVVPFKTITNFSDPSANFSINTNLGCKTHESTFDKMKLNNQIDIRDIEAHLRDFSFIDDKNRSSKHLEENITFHLDLDMYIDENQGLIDSFLGIENQKSKTKKKPLKGKIVSFDEIKAKATQKRKNNPKK